ncbi:MAG: NUDIX hydrolase [Microbacteriaceae bacterium]
MNAETNGAGTSTVVAAGAVCWRRADDQVQVLLVHRNERDDVSLPKGKLDPGETPPQTAVREVAEETGLAITLGATLGTIDYPLSDGRRKLVYYWVAEVDGSTSSSQFTANQEIAALQWLPVEQARAALSYDRDRDVLDRFSERVAAGTLRTFSIVALRHGKAVPAIYWDGPDATRPLLHRGIEQAANIAPAIAAWHPVKLISSPATRCLDTIAPTARLLGLEVKPSSAISQDAYDDDPDGIRDVVAKRVRLRRTAVLCSHGPVLPRIIAELAGAAGAAVDGRLQEVARLRTGHYAVVHLSAEGPASRVVAVEAHGPAEETTPAR